MDVQPPRSVADAGVLRGILLDFCDAFEDMDEEADRVALARRVAALLETMW